MRARIWKFDREYWVVDFPFGASTHATSFEEAVATLSEWAYYLLTLEKAA